MYTVVYCISFSFWIPHEPLSTYGAPCWTHSSIFHFKTWGTVAVWVPIPIESHPWRRRWPMIAVSQRGEGGRFEDADSGSKWQVCTIGAPKMYDWMYSRHCSTAKTLAMALKLALHPVFLATSWAQLRIILQLRHGTGYRNVTRLPSGSLEMALTQTIRPRLTIEIIEYWIYV